MQLMKAVIVLHLPQTPYGSAVLPVELTIGLSVGM